MDNKRTRPAVKRILRANASKFQTVWICFCLILKNNNIIIFIYYQFSKHDIISCIC